MYEGAERRSRSRWLYRFTDPLECVGCGAKAGGDARGWRGYRPHEPETDDPPQVQFYCAYCSIREFG